MPVIDRLTVELEADFARYRAGMLSGETATRQFGRVADGTARSVAGQFAGGLGIQVAMTAATAGINLATAALRGMAGAVTDLIGSGVRLAADYETAEVSLAGMLGSADRAKAMLSDLAALANNSSLQLPGVVQAGNNLLAFGVEPDQILPTLRTLGDLARGDAQKFQDLATIYGKVLTGGVTNEDIIQIAERGIGIYAELGRQMGRTKEQVKALASQSQVGISDIQRAFVALTGPGGQFHDQLATGA